MNEYKPLIKLEGKLGRVSQLPQGSKLEFLGKRSDELYLLVFMDGIRSNEAQLFIGKEGEELQRAKITCFGYSYEEGITVGFNTSKEKGTLELPNNSKSNRRSTLNDKIIEELFVEEAK